MKQYITTVLEGQFFALDLDLVQEICTITSITPVPMSPDYILGLEDSRGQMVTILDIGKIIRTESSDVAATHYMILRDASIIQNNPNLYDGNVTEELIGIAVNSVGEVITVNEDEVSEPPGNLKEIDKEYIEGVVSMNDKVYILLNLYKVLGIAFSELSK